MTWTVPFTAIDGTPFTAAQYNNNVRNNMVETEVSRAQTVTGYCVTAGMNQLVERVPATSVIGTTDTTASAGTYTDLDNTSGPEVSVVTGTMAFVSISCSLSNTSSAAAWMSHAVSGATESEAADSFGAEMQSNVGQKTSSTILRTDLTPGINVFTAKYRVSTSGTGSFAARRITIFPF